MSKHYSILVYKNNSWFIVIRFAGLPSPSLFSLLLAHPAASEYPTPWTFGLTAEGEDWKCCVCNNFSTHFKSAEYLTNKDEETGQEESSPHTNDYWHILKLDKLKVHLFRKTSSTLIEVQLAIIFMICRIRLMQFNW